MRPGKVVFFVVLAFAAAVIIGWGLISYWQQQNRPARFDVLGTRMARAWIFWEVLDSSDLPASVNASACSVYVRGVILDTGKLVPPDGSYVTLTVPNCDTTLGVNAFLGTVGMEPLPGVDKEFSFMFVGWGAGSGATLSEESVYYNPDYDRRIELNASRDVIYNGLPKCTFNFFSMRPDGAIENYRDGCQDSGYFPFVRAEWQSVLGTNDRFFVGTVSQSGINAYPLSVLYKLKDILAPNLVGGADDSYLYQVALFFRSNPGLYIDPNNQQ